MSTIARAIVDKLDLEAFVCQEQIIRQGNTPITHVP